MKTIADFILKNDKQQLQEARSKVYDLINYQENKVLIAQNRLADKASGWNPFPDTWELKHTLKQEQEILKQLISITELISEQV
jgi:hypothetical protein